ncbi:MAG: hypothetical protein WDN30_14175 [Pararobbsia sp.]
MLRKAHDRSVAAGDRQRAEIPAFVDDAVRRYPEKGRRHLRQGGDDEVRWLPAAHALRQVHGVCPQGRSETGGAARDPETDQPIVHYFGMFQTEAEAKREHERQIALYHDDPDVRVERGVKSEKSHQLYEGLSPETLALFADKVGADEAMKQVIQLAMSERSALKRRLERRAVEGFSDGPAPDPVELPHLQRPLCVAALLHARREPGDPGDSQGKGRRDGRGDQAQAVRSER